ncbi:MAG TPA: hypothetical protein VM223_28075 [Planctomycetota bacterium]|nr:hypothetical protein [Planctomycetota bacterium]
MNESLESVLEKVGRVLSDRYGIRVVCKGNRCCTDGKVIYLPALPDEVPTELMGAIRAFLDHEVGHIVGNSDMALGGEFRRKHGDDAFSVLNALEDLRVEEVMRRAYAGCGINLRAGYEFATRLLAACAGGLEPVKHVTTALYSRGSGYDDLPFIDQRAYAVCDEVASEITSCVSARDTAEVAIVAERVWNAVRKHIASRSQKPKARKPGDPMQGPGGNQQAPGRDRQSAPDGHGTDHEQADGKAAGKTAPPAPDAGSGASQEPGQGAPAQGAAPAGLSVSSGTTGGSHGPMAELPALIEQGIAAYAATSHAYRVWTTEFDVVQVAPNKRQHDHQAMLAGVMPYVGGVRQRLLQSLQAEANCRWFGDQEKGSVDPKSLHRLAMETSSRVFRQRVRSRTKSTAATLLIDLSSSMRGAKLELAMKTAIVFCEALERLAIPSSVIGFSTAESDLLKRVAEQSGTKESDLVRQYRFVPLRHTILKRFEEPWRKVSGRFTTIHSQNLTPLGESLLFAARDIAGRREERKVIMCLTDGKPVAGIDPEDVTFQHAKDAIVRIERARIEVILIGIMEPSVERLHRKNVIVRSLQELPGTVIRQLQSILMKGICHETTQGD